MPNGNHAAAELPVDNAARIAIYDAMTIASAGRRDRTVGEGALFDHVIGRLRLLVPRELHVMGEPTYFAEKVNACVSSGLLERSAGGPDLLKLTGTPPQVMYPDGTVRDYPAGLEEARERLNADDQRLRKSAFDVHKLVSEPSPRSSGFRALVESMREHGCLKQFAIVEDVDENIIDGRSRAKAAVIAKVKIARSTSKDRIPRRLATPLHRTILFLDLNRQRLTAELREETLTRLAEKAERAWPRIDADLHLTRDWRLAAPIGYSSAMEVEEVPYQPNGTSKVQLTTDGSRVMLGSLLRAAGLQGHKRDELRPYVAIEEAYSSISGRPAFFVAVDDAVTGIATMVEERRKSGLRVSPGWDDAREWLLRRSAALGAYEPTATGERAD